MKRNLPLEVLNGHRAKLVREIEERQAAIEAIDRTIAVLLADPTEVKWLGNMTLAEQREVYDRYVAGAK